MKKSIFMCFIIACLASCKSTQISTPETPANAEKTATINSDSILSLEFYIYKKLPVDSIALYKFSKIKAYLNKDDFTQIPAIPEGKIRCSILDENKHIIKSILIDNPLILNAEYTEGDEHQILKMKSIELEKKYLNLRTNYSESMRYVLFETLDKTKDIYIYPLFELF